MTLQILSSVHAFYVCPPAVYTSLPVYWLLKAWAQCHTNVPCLWKERCNNNRKCVVAHYHSRLSVTLVVELELDTDIDIMQIFKVGKFLKGILDWSRSPSPSLKFKLWEENIVWGVKAKHCWALSKNVWKQKVCWHHPAMFCLITSIKLFRQ